MPRRNNPVLDNINKKFASELYVDNELTISEVAECMGISYYAAYCTLEALDVIRKNYNGRGRSGKKIVILTADIIEKIKHLYVDKQLSVNETAKLLRLGYKKTLNTLHDLGVVRTQSESEILLWSKPEFKHYNLHKIMAGSRNKQNYSEKYLEDMIFSDVCYSFMYNGSRIDGKHIVISGYVPDFIDINGKK